jgi:hypothetical protein
MAAPEEELSLAAYFLSSMRDGKLDRLLDTWIKNEVRAHVIESSGPGEAVPGDVRREERPSMIDVAELPKSLTGLGSCAWQVTTSQFLLVIIEA